MARARWYPVSVVNTMPPRVPARCGTSAKWSQWVWVTRIASTAPSGAAAGPRARSSAAASTRSGVPASNAPAAMPVSNRVTYGSTRTVLCGVRIFQPDVPSHVNEAYPGAAVLRPAAGPAAAAGAVPAGAVPAGAVPAVPRARAAVAPPSAPSTAVPAPVMRARRLGPRTAPDRVLPAGVVPAGVLPDRVVMPHTLGGCVPAGQRAVRTRVGSSAIWPLVTLPTWTS